MRNLLSIYPKLVVTVVFICGTITAFGQLQKFPLPKGGDAARVRETTREKTDTIRLTLPFWDDFTVSDGQYPDTLKWLQGFAVTVNNGMAINQPTINVVTFDGLDSIGNAYSPQQVLETGFNDVLASQPIDLSENALSLEQRDSVFLSFFYQWQGTGEAPDNADFMQLEFRKKDSTWVPVVTINTTPDLDRTIFYDTIVKVDDPDYFYEDFQFRFRNFGRKSGPYDTWNIDYVYLNSGRSQTGNDFRDVAFASVPASIFGEYTSIPYKHFKVRKEIFPLEFDGQNLQDTIYGVGFNIDGKFTNYYSNDTSIYSKTFFEPNTNTVVYDPGQRHHYEHNLLSDNQIVFDDPQQFDPNAKSVDIDFKLLIYTKDFQSSQLNFKINDTVSVSWKLRDYYSYDDGTAEFSAGLIEPGSKIAYQYNLYAFDTLKSDTLNAIQFYFPSYGVSANQTVSFTVYHDENGKPGRIWQTYPPRPVGQKGINVFDELKLIPSLLINEPTFYIGWAQPFAGKALIGLDNDNDTGDRIFVSEPGLDWYQNDIVQGSLMLRPVFGKGELDETTAVEEKIHFGMYPNPTTGVFFIDGIYDQIHLLTSTGSEVEFQAERSGDKTRIEVNRPSGLYLIRLTRGTKSSTQKIIISR